MEPRIDLLADGSPTLDTVLAWHWHEWSSGDDGDLEVWRARLRSRTLNDAVPFTLVGFLDDEPVGCLSVCHEDVDARFAAHGPWLSGVFVTGRARNLGVGRALVGAAEDRVRELGMSEVWLYTAEAGPFYERCGWTYAHRKEHVADNAVMSRRL